MRAFLLLIFLSTSAAAATPAPGAMPGSCREAAAPAQPPQIVPDGWLLLAALVVCAAGRWSR